MLMLTSLETMVMGMVITITILIINPHMCHTNIPSSNVSSDLENTIRSFISTQKELNKVFISKFEKQDSLFER